MALMTGPAQSSELPLFLSFFICYNPPSFFYLIPAHTTTNQQTNKQKFNTFFSFWFIATRSRSFKPFIIHAFFVVPIKNLKHFSPFFSLPLRFHSYFDSMSVEARTGRLRQRYDNNFRLVSGCIPYRLTKDAEDANEDIETQIEVLMVSSPNRSDLVFPKGGWENDETVLEAACREALEEAGVKGKLNEKPLGIWEFRSKSRLDVHSLEGGCRGYMFALEVTEELEIWPEQGNRDRKWLNIKDAFQLCRYEWMREALDEFLRVMSEERKTEIAEEIMEPLPEPVPDVIADCQIMTPNCCVTTTSSQHSGISAINPLHWHIALKRLPLT